MDVNDYLAKKLIDERRFAQKQINAFLEHVKPDNPLANVLVDQGAVGEDEALQFLSEYYGLPSVNLNHYKIDKALLEIVNRSFAMKNHILPLFKVRNTLMLAMYNPSEIHLLDEVRIKTGMGVDPVVALPSSIKKAIDRSYGISETVTGVIDTIKDEKIGITQLDKDQELANINLEAGDDEPIVKLVNLFISQAVRERASDIHINPEEKELRVRNRVDGILHEIATPPKKFEPAIVSRIKVLANLDIAEKRKPQDGRIKMRTENKTIDIRVSTFPTIYGENVVMRILDSASVLYGLDEIGMLPDALGLFEKLIKRPYGIILVTGPTGSGKTTTLYSALETINSIDKNILTLEDPVEYNLRLIRQAQVNPKAEFTFATGLRAILRQDPDIIMVGEIRDLETAEIAVEAALTGHLVLSTLHTNDSLGTIIRLVDMGIERFLIASSVIGVVAQRLIRKICTHCKESYVPAPESLREIGMDPSKVTQFYRGRGCQQCFNTGYSGRIGIYEVLEVTPQLSEAILKDVGAVELQKIAQEEGLRLLRTDGMEKVKSGITTIEEVLRVTKEG
ncbi:MAG: type II secretion system ATPase GspE [Candidatus Omnitrophica bacterium]|nr:type II secretion system ATPase GspE [Candidatus Omnitrophota bacterium]